MSTLRRLVCLANALAILLFAAPAQAEKLSELASRVLSCDRGALWPWLAAGLVPDMMTGGDTLLGLASQCNVSFPNGMPAEERCGFAQTTRFAVVDALLSAGADPNLPNESGYTPIVIAMLVDCNSMAITALFDAGARTTGTPLSAPSAMEIVLGQDTGVEYLELLALNVGIDVDGLDARGLTPLLTLALMGPMCREDDPRVAKFELLLALGASPEDRTPDDFDPSFSSRRYAGLNVREVLEKRIALEDGIDMGGVECFESMLSILPAP